MKFDRWRSWCSTWVMLLVALPAAAQTAAAVDLQPFLRKDNYEAIKISPTGEFYAATVPLADRTILVRRSRIAKTPSSPISGG
jgi:hypothetical protein